MEWSTLIHKAAYGDRGLTLENLDDAPPEGGEEHIEQLADAHEDNLEAQEDLAEALESISDYANRLAKLIATDTISVESLALIRHGVDLQLDRIGKEIAAPALEGVAEGDVKAEATIVLENFTDFLKNMAQAYVMTFKHIRDALIDGSRAVAMVLPRHEKKMLECRRHWNDVKKDLVEGEVRFAPIGFEYFLTLGNMQNSSEIVKEIKTDVEVDKYLLVTYPKAILSELSSVISAVNAASVKSVADIVKLGKKVEGFKTPEELLDNKYKDKAVFFGGNIATGKNKPKKTAQGHDAESLTRLAELAGSGMPRLKMGMRATIMTTLHAVNGNMPNFAVASLPAAASAGAVIGTIAAVHGAGKVAAAAVHGTVDSSNYFVKTSQIPTFFDASEGYLDNIRAHLGLERQFIRVIDEADGAIEKLEDRVGEAYESKMHGKEASQTSFDTAWAETEVAMKVIKQIMQYMDALSRSITRVSSFEQRRAFHAAKSCNYMGLRLIFNAPTKGMATESSDAAQENIRQMDEALNALHAVYHKKMTDSGDTPERTRLKQELADKEYHIREKFKNSHPSTESFDDSHYAVLPDEVALEAAKVNVDWHPGTHVKVAVASKKAELHGVADLGNGTFGATICANPKGAHVLVRFANGVYGKATPAGTKKNGADMNCSAVGRFPTQQEAMKHFKLEN